MFYSRFLVMVLAFAFPFGGMAAADTVTGSATFRERIMPPADARFVAILSDISRADVAAVELGRIEIENAGGPPYAFEIQYDRSEIQPNHSYAVRATLWAGDRMMFTTDTVAPVLTRGASDEVNITMVRVASEAQSNPVAVQPQIGAHGLQLPATFVGTLPCADCEGISYHLDLWPDQGYHLRREWLGEAGGASANTQDDIGFWYLEVGTNAIALAGVTDTPAQWEVKAPNKIRQLDMDRNAIVSDLPYDLTSNGGLDETDIEKVFIGGMMTYMADAAVFEECRTGRIYPVVMDGDYLALEQAYLTDQAAVGASLYVNVEGSFLMRPAMEGEDQRSLVVNQFVRTRPGITCERQRADASLTNTYWKIDVLAVEDVVGLPSGGREAHVILRENDGRFSTTVGCNGMSGEFTQRHGMLKFGRTAATMMACPPPLGDLEQSLAQALEATQCYRINGETLVFYGERDEVLALMTAVYLY
ncbi:putative lipoprotein YbaY/heat shock protein HslJ [Loktanella ponticola]|uniref:Putative lipoprotein YbaY/heat shock protein HslJ n=1 Tax=Yoonia ponticola TaxID=1524255 RepID=A0A7W9BNX3_9RHOB|nr:YbaY family lipoprotein [Yoonia ponticola]MBB5723979.1 putative lipoprotein YbaY/heat shock protein HslJ [Yoonia ponticola]